MDKRSVLVTGCSTGIGRDAARTLKDRGWRVLASCRKSKDLSSLESEGFETLSLDYENPDSIDEGFSRVVEILGGVPDAIFNNGAYAIPAAVEDLPVEALRQQFEANFFGWHQLTRLCLPYMLERGSGRIVQNSSVVGFSPFRLRGAYVASKYALEGLTDCLRLELRGTGVEVILIEPGPIASSFRSNAIRQHKKWISAEDSRWQDAYATYMGEASGKQKESFVMKFELPASAVTKKLVLALESKRPRPRYYVTLPTYISGLARRLLSTRAQDRLSMLA